MPHHSNKTLIILIGNARGGEETWSTMYKNLLEPYQADLALCFGEEKEKKSSLYQRATYLWEIPEYANWREFYESNFPANWDGFMKNQRFKYAALMGGIDDNKGSGAIIFAFRHYLLKNQLSTLLQYDRIILTRSDFYYIDQQPILPLGKLYAVEGEEYGGVSDRHFIFDSGMSEEVLGILNFLCDEQNFDMLNQLEKDSINPEKALLLFFKHNHIFEKLVFHKRVQFTVGAEGDSSRWQNPSHFIPGLNGVKYKYVTEYEDALWNSMKKNGLFTKSTYLYLLHFSHKCFFTKAGYYKMAKALFYPFKMAFPSTYQTIYTYCFHVKNFEK